jgi:TolB protein
VVAFVSDWAGDDDVYLLDPSTGALLNLTDAPGEDRDPAFAPDGRTLFYRSNRGGKWAFYGVDLATGEHVLRDDGLADWMPYRGGMTQAGLADAGTYVFEAYREDNLDLYLYTAGGVRRLTGHPAGDYDPAWRPGASQVAFASWRAGKDLYLLDTHSAQSGGEPTRLTEGPADDESPAWHPDGQRLAFARWVDGDADLYELDLSAGGEPKRLTGDPYPDLAPAYGPDGTLFWTRYVPGAPFEVHDPFRPGHWQLWVRADGQDRPVDLPIPGMDVYAPAVADALWPGLPPATLLPPTPAPTLPPGQVVDLVTLDIACAGKYPRLHAYLGDDYEAWRAEVLAQAGYDVLGSISDMFRPLGYSTRDYGHLSWHRTARTLDLLFEWPHPESGENQMLVVRDDLGPQTYWRLYLKTARQDGTLGEPLTAAPWVFWFELDPSKEAAAYAAGGRPGEIPPGYYVDLTRLAHRHGWHRIASYEESDFDWRTDSVGREFWHYQRADGLTWWEAMRETYPLETLEQTYGWTVCTEELGLDPAWLRAKGIPTPAPVQ